MDEHVHSAPELWRKHRPEAPTRPITHALIWIDGQKAGRVDEPEIDHLDEDLLRAEFPYLNRGRHEVMIDFRSTVGRGALGQVRITVENGFEAEPVQADQDDAPSELVSLCIRLMGQNEKLQKNLLEATNHHSSAQMDSHERLIQFMTMSMERDRERHNAWMEKESSMRQHISERDDARMQTHSAEQKELLSMLISMANNGGAPGAAPNPLMDYVQGKIMEGMMGQVDGMIDKATSPQGGMEGLLSAVGPLLAQKFAEPAVPPPPAPGNEQ